MVAVKGASQPGRLVSVRSVWDMHIPWPSHEHEWGQMLSAMLMVSAVPVQFDHDSELGPTVASCH